MANKEYIERDAVIGAITTDGFEHFSGCLSSSEVSLLELMRDSVNEIPAADVVEVRRGKWNLGCEGIKLSKTQAGGYGYYVYCSECQTVGSPQWKCCPVCGAKMDGENK